MKNDFAKQVRKITLEEILRGNFLTEKKLAERFGVSRTPIREVLSALEKDGVLERKKNAGIRLRQPALKEIIEIYDLRTALEGIAVRILAIHIDRKTINILETLCRKETRIRKLKSPQSPESDRAEFAFHQKLIDACGNTHLKRVADNFQILTQSFRLTHNLHNPPHNKEGYFTHEQIIVALKAKNPDKAEETTRLHIQEGKENVVRQILGPTVSSGEVRFVSLKVNKRNS